jgi:hypothetical protein
VIEIYMDEQTIERMPWYWTSHKDYDEEIEAFSIGSQLYAQMLGWA